MTIGNLLSVLLALWGIGFLVTRTHVLHRSYNKRITDAGNNRWLHEQCKSHEFYHNMKHHSTLCEDVASTERDSVLLGAFADMIDQTYLCGYESCEEILARGVMYIAKQGFWAITGVTVGLLIFMVALVPIARAYQRYCLRQRHLYLREDLHQQYSYDLMYEPKEVRSLTDVHRRL